MVIAPNALDLTDLDSLAASRKDTIEALCKKAFAALTPEEINDSLYDSVKNSRNSFAISIFTAEEVAEIEKTETDLLKRAEESTLYGELKKYFDGFDSVEVSLTRVGDKPAQGIAIEFNINDYGLSHSSNVFSSKSTAAAEKLEAVKQAARKARDDLKLPDKFLTAIGRLPVITVPHRLDEEQYKAIDKEIPLDPHPELSDETPQLEGEFTVFNPDRYAGLPLTNRALYELKQKAIEELFFESFSYHALRSKILDAVEDADPKKEELTVGMQVIARGAYKKSNPLYHIIGRAFGGYSRHGSASHDYCHSASIDSFRPDSFAARLYHSLISVGRVTSVELGTEVKITLANPHYQPKTALASTMGQAALPAPAQETPKTSDLIQQRIDRFNTAIDEFKTIAAQIEGFEPDTNKLEQLAQEYETKLTGTDTILYSQNMQSAVFRLEDMTRALGILNGDIAANRTEQFSPPEIEQISADYEGVFGLLENGIAKLDAFYMNDRAASLSALSHSVGNAQIRAAAVTKQHLRK